MVLPNNANFEQIKEFGEKKAQIERKARSEWQLYQDSCHKLGSFKRSSARFLPIEEFLESGKWKEVIEREKSSKQFLEFMELSPEQREDHFNLEKFFVYFAELTQP